MRCAIVGSFGVAERCHISDDDGRYIEGNSAKDVSDPAGMYDVQEILYYVELPTTYHRPFNSS